MKAMNEILDLVEARFEELHPPSRLAELKSLRVMFETWPPAQQVAETLDALRVYEEAEEGEWLDGDCALYAWTDFFTALLESMVNENEVAGGRYPANAAG